MTEERTAAEMLCIAVVWMVVAWVVLSMSCCTPWMPPRPIDPPVGDCARACERLRAMGCPAGDTTPEGATCERVCVDTEATGWTSMHPACVATATTCDEASRVSADGCAP